MSTTSAVAFCCWVRRGRLHSRCQTVHRVLTADPEVATTVSFQSAGADAYGSFMGPYATPLAVLFADHAGVSGRQRVLDVGCGPGALTELLVSRLGPGAVCAVEPSPTFAAAARRRLPHVALSRAFAEHLPFSDQVFDVVAAQLVVHFMADPAGGLREMRRVTRRGGTVAACVWDYGGGRGPASMLWQAARELDPSAADESDLAGVRAGHLITLFDEAGLEDLRAETLTVAVRYPSFEHWWRPLTLGVGPAGTYVAALDSDRRGALRRHCRTLVPAGPVEVSASAWTVAGRA
jgi:SAM-dependent methyltransferase